MRTGMRWGIGIAIVAVAVVVAVWWSPAVREIEPGSFGEGQSGLFEIATENCEVTFAVIGDYGQAGPNEQAVAELVKSWDPDFIATVGDNNYPDGAATTIDANIGQYYHEYIHPYKGTYGEGARVNRFFPALGNHDWHTRGAKPYLDYFELPGNERYYDIAWGPVHLFILDSSSTEPDGITASSAQAQWLQHQLTQSPAPWKLVLLHHAPYSSGANHGSNPILQWPYEEWGADAVLAGHEHTYERLLIGETPYFVNGLGGGAMYAMGSPLPGSQVRHAFERGAMKVEASAEEITYSFMTVDGEVIDSYTETREPSGVCAPIPLAAQDQSQ